MDDRPAMSQPAGDLLQVAFGALASTPPAVGYCLRLLDPPFAACSSEGPVAGLRLPVVAHLLKERLSAAIRRLVRTAPLAVLLHGRVVGLGERLLCFLRRPAQGAAETRSRRTPPRVVVMGMGSSFSRPDRLSRTAQGALPTGPPRTRHRADRPVDTSRACGRPDGRPSAAGHGILQGPPRTAVWSRPCPSFPRCRPLPSASTPPWPGRS